MFFCLNVQNLISRERLVIPRHSAVPAPALEVQRWDCNFSNWLQSSEGQARKECSLFYSRSWRSQSIINPSHDGKYTLHITVSSYLFMKKNNHTQSSSSTNALTIIFLKQDNHNLPIVKYDRVWESLIRLVLEIIFSVHDKDWDVGSYFVTQGHWLSLLDLPTPSLTDQVILEKGYSVRILQVASDHSGGIRQ